MKHSIFSRVVFSFLITLLPFHTALAITSRDVLRSVLENDSALKYFNIADLPGMSVPYHIAQPLNTTPIDTNFSTRYTFTDQEKDDESGLLYFGSRYYDPVIGRFTQPDPVIIDPTRPEFQNALYNPQLLNAYSYVANNPVKMVDKNGEMGFLAPVLVYLPAIVSAVTIALPMIPAMFNNPMLTAQATIRTSPISGDAIDITEALTGRDAFSGQQFGGLERGATIVGATLPFIPNQVTRGLTKTEAVQGLIRIIDRMSIVKQFDNLNGKTINDAITIPENWMKSPTQSKGGVQYTNPTDPSNYIRVMPGNPKNEYFRGPYMRIENGNNFYDINGNVVDEYAGEGHIPIKNIK
ncbi:MAG: hypothetical protein A2986_00780 [Candidatus Jacksonbacteria bacterium RIFCSPLOWO2_01_FULL_44_13]|nr:MAG: hypothetical protein A2986_00780 [Candidatus Jacksonbacteria bacterium RIFCSPLOWO2_01_FULL_44_13]